MRRLRPLSPREFASAIAELEGSSAGVVYSFAPQASPCKLWYDQWRSDVISAYGLALEALGVHPYYIDVETFCRQALNGELPDLTCAFNLNAGVTPITHWAVMPAVSAWCGVPPLPVEADVLIVGERKDTAALMAASLGFPSPPSYRLEELPSLPPAMELIIKPRDLGGSVGLTKINASRLRATSLAGREPMIIQEFVAGLDLTVPIVFQPSSGRHRVVAGVLYIPDDENPFDWIHTEESKLSGGGYRKLVVPLPDWLADKAASYADAAGLGAYSRLDLRIRARGLDASTSGFWDEEVLFLEVNPLPTLRHDINFLNVVASDAFRSAFYEEYRIVQEIVGQRVRELPLALVLAIAITTLGRDG